MSFVCVMQLGSHSGTTRESLQRELASFEQDYTSAPTGGAVKWQLLQELRRLFDNVVGQARVKRALAARWSQSWPQSMCHMLYLSLLTC